MPKGVAALSKGESDREKLIGDRKREKAEEKLDKRRAKEMRKQIDKEREAEKKAKRKSKQTAGAATAPGAACGQFKMDGIGAAGALSEKNFIPLFLERCVEFIELEGLDSEGIYRVPGNRAHVDLLYQKLQEGKNQGGRLQSGSWVTDLKCPKCRCQY